VAALSLVALLVLLAIMAPILLNLTILRPFNRLSKALVNDTGDGPFPYLPEPSSQISEVRTLESALATLNKAVARQVDELESRVRERTRELEEARALLVRTETLATLGQLAAGIAHELNTPLGAISSSVRMLQTDWANSLLPLLAKQVRLPVTGEAETFLRELTELAGNLEDYPDASSRRALKKRWVELGRDPEATTFDLVSSTGLWRRLDELAAWPEDPELNRILAVTLQWVRSLSIISSATEKSAAVVSALRTQVQPGAETEHKPLELKREIDHAMALLQNKIKNGIQVEVSAPSPVWVLGDATALSKVWLNLVLNAIQAMDGSGQLEIQVSRTGAWGLVTVTDSGPGIPSEILHRVFEPFFTTKSTGMGLGLEIARKMVEQNHGRLDVESRSGRTTFSVQLPVFEHEEP
jgi:signal transduction histidine kinase